MPTTSAEDQFRAPGNAERAKGLCVLAFAAVLVATLWPLNPIPRNGVTWLQGTKGLRFESPGLVVSDGPLKPPVIYAPESYTVELLLRPASVKSLATILGFYRPTHPTQLLVQQAGDGLFLTRDTAVERERVKMPRFYVDHVFRSGKLVFVAISSGPTGTKVYVDNQAHQSFPRLKISRDDLLSEVVLGTSPARYDPWSGEIYGLAIYGREIATNVAPQHYNGWTTFGRPLDVIPVIALYTFSGAAGRNVRNEVVTGPDLEIPTTFSVPHKGLLRSPLMEFSPDWSYVFDASTNIGGFVPLGLLVCSCLLRSMERWKAVMTTTVICTVFSFVIEVLQYYIPKRGSGVTDIITNTLGAALGAGLTQMPLTRRALESE